MMARECISHTQHAYYTVCTDTYGDYYEHPGKDGMEWNGLMSSSGDMLYK